MNSSTFLSCQKLRRRKLLLNTKGGKNYPKPFLDTKPLETWTEVRQVVPRDVHTKNPFWNSVLWAAHLCDTCKGRGFGYGR